MNNARKAVHERDAHRIMVKNILDVWEVAVERQLHLTDWYREAFDTCLQLAGEFDLPVNDVAWVVATLSPHLSWHFNLQSAISFLSSWRGIPYHYTNCAYGRQTYKCELYMLGELSGLPTGRKVHAFYHNLLLDYSHVTIDRHAWRIAYLGARGLEKESGDGEFGDVDFRVCVKAYRTVAEQLNITPALLQSIVWQVVARENY